MRYYLWWKENGLYNWMVLVDGWLADQHSMLLANLGFPNGIFRMQEELWDVEPTYELVCCDNGVYEVNVVIPVVFKKKVA